MQCFFQISDLSKRYGSNIIFDKTSVQFYEDQKVGVIGRNGAGKSTLFKIMIAQEEADEGILVRSKELRLGYLEQLDPFRPEETVLQFLQRTSGKEDWKCGKTAVRFQLQQAHLQEKIEKLSGGYQMRVKLAALLLHEPNFLMLDEPTNYLDLHTLILLEHFLQDFRGGFLIISHDREFLKRTCENTLEVENRKLVFYPGKIEEYLAFKEEQIELKIKHNKNVEEKQKQLQRFVDRFRAKATKASQAQSKLKQIERLKKIEIEHTPRSVNIKIPAVEYRKGFALSCQNVNIGYPEKTVATEIHLSIERGHHIAVLGDNGQGKTTLLRTLAGDLPMRSGEIQWGKTLKISYYAQHTSQMLMPDDSVETYLQKIAPPEVLRQDILNMAGCFLFSGDDVRKKISVLSGGERARLCLAGLLLSKSDVLLLDEPTNHLDFETVEALGYALKTFAGTIFFISHDRTFVNLVATGIIEIKAGKVSLYPGTYEDYVYHLENEVEAALAEILQEKPEPSKPIPSVTSSGDKSKTSYEQRKELRSKMTRLNTQIKKLEDQMAEIETEKRNILDELTKDPTTYHRSRYDRLEELTQLQAARESEWLTLSEEIEALSRQIEASS